MCVCVCVCVCVSMSVCLFCSVYNYKNIFERVSLLTV